MEQPRLSICIPTYNRQKYLNETISSILNQIDENNASKVEICISDNASTDGTEELIAAIQQSTLVNIIYSRSEHNMGADVNYLRAVELASGDYCWYMGSDDIAMPGSLQTFLREIKSGHDIYLCNRVECDINMIPKSNFNWLDKRITSESFDFANPTQFERYTRLSKSIGALFSYLSSIIFKREKWTSILIDQEFIGTAYSHTYMLLSLIKTGCILKYLPEHLVSSRGDNDSFLGNETNAAVSRIMLDIKGYSLLANKLFKDAPLYHSGILRVLHAERPPLITLSYLRIHSDDVSWTTIAAICRAAGYSPVWLSFLGMSKPILQMAKKIRDRTRTATKKVYS